MNFEIRWLVRGGWDGPEKVLQYRTQLAVTDYSSLHEPEHDFIPVIKWSEWEYVQTVDETK